MRAFRPSRMVRPEEDEDDLIVRKAKSYNIQVYAQLVRARKPLFESVDAVNHLAAEAG